MADVSYDQIKLKELLHYITHKCGALENVGKTVLYKLLYFSDFNYYELHEQPISGETYAKLPHGPAPRHFDNVMSELLSENKIQSVNVNFKGKPQQKFLCVQEPKPSHLSAEELLVVDKVINQLSSMNATQISDFSHGDIPWKAAKDGEDLDYEMVFYRNGTYSVREYDDNNL